MNNHTPVGTRRRLQALACMGWPTTAIAARTGLPEVMIAAAQGGAFAAWGDDFDGRIARAYREILARCPDGGHAAVREAAAAAGWQGPLAWDEPDTDEAPEAAPKRAHRSPGAQVVDPFAVEEALSRRDGRDLNRAERLVAARRLGMPNSPNSVICTKLGLSTTVAKSLRAALEAADRELATRQAVPAA